jgi:hypothetical protein
MQAIRNPPEHHAEPCNFLGPLHEANRPHMFIAFWLAESPSPMPYHPRVSYLMLSVHLYLSLLLI